MVKVMIFDEDRTFSIMLKKDLEVCGFNVVTRFTGIDGVDFIVKNAPDLLLMNYDLPVVSGCSIVKEIRRLNVTTPVIFFSSQNDVNEVVNCFESGGNDYIRKPIELRELIVRMKNQLTDVKLKNLQVDEYQFIRVNDLCFDFISNTISKGDIICRVTKTQSLILRCLLINKGRIVDFESIARECFGYEEFTVAAMNSLKVLLCKLRKNLSKCGITDIRIETYRRKGMCLYI